VRETNEDYLLVDEKLRLFVVADGMGGHECGEVASRMAVDSLRQSLSKRLARAKRTTSADLVEAMREAFQDATETVVQYAEEQHSDMATTMTAVMIHNKTLILGHIGDSRAYKISGGKIEQISEDHSLVAQMVRDGLLSEALAEFHPFKHIVLRAIGGQVEDSVPDISTVPLQDTDSILLCSDGLSNVLSSQEIFQIVHEHEDPTEAAEALVRAANENGGPDNISVIVVRGPWETSQSSRRATRRFPLQGTMLVLGLLSMITIGWACLTSRVYYLGVHEGKVAVYRGIPGLRCSILPARPFRVENVRVEELLPPYRQRLVEGIPLSSLAQAGEQIAAMRPPTRRGKVHIERAPPLPLRPPSFAEKEPHRISPSR